MSLISVLFATDASARLNTWANYYSPARAKTPNFGIYLGVRAYASMLTGNTENKLLGKSIKKSFYRKYYEWADS
ncbi:MAG: hypothetical protein LBU68_00480, partial [Rickettsiales bacterium]|nr:hypothetical protein [Rickettsiales bacterium]